MKIHEAGWSGIVIIILAVTIPPHFGIWDVICVGIGLFLIGIGVELKPRVDNKKENDK